MASYSLPANLISNTLDDSTKMGSESCPSFRQWFRQTWLDCLTMAVLGGVGLAVCHDRYVNLAKQTLTAGMRYIQVFFLPPLPSRSFPVQSTYGLVFWPQFAYPKTDQVVHIWVVVLLVTLIPVAVILLMQIRIRSFWDANNAILGLLYSLITAAVFQVILKWLIGGMRPQFLSICQPDLHDPGNGFANIMHDTKSCRGKSADVNKALDSFPSGHSTAAFAGFVFLSLYLNAKLKIFANYQPRMWKLVLLYAPVLGATLIAGSLVVDHSHNWYDVFAGAIIGLIMAMSSFRMMYASIWDFNTNHIALRRNSGNAENGRSDILDIASSTVDI